MVLKDNGKDIIFVGATSKEEWAKSLCNDYADGSFFFIVKVENITIYGGQGAG